MTDLQVEAEVSLKQYLVVTVNVSRPYKVLETPRFKTMITGHRLSFPQRQQQWGLNRHIRILKEKGDDTLIGLIYVTSKADLQIIKR